MTVDTQLIEKKSRQIGRWGTASRLALGGLFIFWAFRVVRFEEGEFVRIGVGWADVIIGLVVFPAVVSLVLALRGSDAPSMRFYGPLGYGLNFLIWGVALLLAPVPTLLFGGVAQLLAAVRGYAGCELFVVSNFARQRDDQIGCPVHSLVDALEADSTSHTA